MWAALRGRNNAEIANSYVATVRSSGSAGSIITARYGFVGGVAGSNNGTIKGSGSKKALVSGDTTTLALVAQVEKWLGAEDANAGINSMAAELTTGKTYAGLKGVDTVTGYGYTNVYSDTGLAPPMICLSPCAAATTARPSVPPVIWAAWQALTLSAVQLTLPPPASGLSILTMRQRHPPSAVLSARTNPTSQTKACWTLW